MLDSRAVFLQRAEEIGLTPEELARIEAKGWSSLAKLAFACSYTPGQQDDSNLRGLGSVIAGTGANDPPEDRMPVYRRLYFEAYTLAAADLRARVERRDDDAPRRLALPERSHRNQDQAIRLRGVVLEGEREVSHALIDAVVQLFDDNMLKYIRWEQCTKRDVEMNGIKSDPVWKPDSSGLIREARVARAITADVSTDLSLKNALQRRSLAFDNCRLVDFAAFERWTDVLIDAYMCDPPTGFAKVTVEQLHRADMQLFKVMMRETRSGIRWSPGGGYPVEIALIKAMDLPEVRLLLQPMQGTSGTKRKADEQELPEGESSTKRLQNRIKNLEARLAANADVGNSRRSKPAGKGKRSGSKGSGKSAPYAIRMPQELIGMDAKTSDDSPICFDFNLGGCKLAAAGASCKKGKHVCCKTGCHKPHSQRSHS
jgi:hypothetical protein